MKDQPNRPFDPLKSFRINHRLLRAGVAQGRIQGYEKLPENVRDLFEQFLDSGSSMTEAVTKRDIMNMIEELCNTDAKEWDQIAHMLL